MPEFTLKGIEQRAKELKGSAARLRWEVDYVLGQVPGGMDAITEKQMRDLDSAMMPLAESLAILQKVVETIDDEVPKQQPMRAVWIQERFNNFFNYFKDFHRVAR